MRGPVWDDGWGRSTLSRFSASVLGLPNTAHTQKLKNSSFLFSHDPGPKESKARGQQGHTPSEGSQERSNLGFLSNFNCDICFFNVVGSFRVTAKVVSCAHISSLF